MGVRVNSRWYCGSQENLPNNFELFIVYLAVSKLSGTVKYVRFLVCFTVMVSAFHSQEIIVIYNCSFE